MYVFDNLFNRFLLDFNFLISLAIFSNSVILLYVNCLTPFILVNGYLALGWKINWDFSGKLNSQIAIL